MAAKTFVVPYLGAFDPLAVPIPGAQAYFTLAGTTTETTIYTDDGLTTPAENPVVADAVGRFPRRYFDDATQIRVRLFLADADVNSDTPLADFDYYEPVEVGAQGPQGVNATVLQIGTVTTRAAGSGATAGVNSLGGGVYSLDIGVPNGATGATTGATWGGITGTLSSQSDLNTALGLKATLASPTFTGTPAAPLAATGTNTTQLATTSFVQQEIAAAKVRQIPINATAMTSRTTNGAAPGTVETTTNKVMAKTLDFDKDTIEYAQFAIPMPKGWDEGTVTAQFLWSSTGTGDVVFGLQAVAISDDDLLDAAFGTAQTVIDTVTATTDLMISTATSAITIGGSPAEGDMVVFQVYRNATSGSDTLNADARLHAVRLSYKTNAKDDS